MKKLQHTYLLLLVSSRRKVIAELTCDVCGSSMCWLSKDEHTKRRRLNNFWMLHLNTTTWAMMSEKQIVIVS
ncbi:hypothetical protein OG21DRAFT_244902 [Imleria badia]|nr:hypothetical protein OG21DRAFT_244902 [Imleria badia]